jgi:TRAP-type C4-dicarboxylate transport system substrate-binding protein
MPILSHWKTRFCTAAASLLMAVSAPAHAATDITLRVADHLPPTHPYVVHGIQYFMDRVTAETKGQVKFRFFPAQQSGSVNDYVNHLQSGLIDIAVTAPPYFSEALPLGNALGLPGWNASTEKLTMAYFSLIRDPKSMFYRIDHERNNLVPLLTSTLGPYQIATRKEIRSVDDFARLRLRSGGGSQDLIISALGAVPVTMPSTEAYEALQRGTLDGLFFPVDALIPMKLYEVLKFTTANLNVSTFIHQWSISKRAFDRLPKDVQDVMLRVGEEATRHLSAKMDQNFNSALDTLKKQGMTVVSLNENNLKRVNELTQPVSEDWARRLSQRNLPAREAMKELERALQR